MQVTTMGKLRNKVAVITGGSAGIGFAAADLFVKEGAYVFITGRRRKELDEAVKAIGKNVTGVQGDVAKLSDLDHLYDTVKATAGASILCSLMPASVNFLLWERSQKSTSTSSSASM
jgi:NAD(P)-dependent dehydrogenase (short-subunit alcohol dehydrogenase family)